MFETLPLCRRCSEQTSDLRIEAGKRSDGGWRQQTVSVRRYGGRARCWRPSETASNGGRQERPPESEVRTSGRPPGGQLRYSTTQVFCGRRLDDITRKHFCGFRKSDSEVFKLYKDIKMCHLLKYSLEKTQIFCHYDKVCVIKATLKPPTYQSGFQG